MSTTPKPTTPKPAAEAPAAPAPVSVPAGPVMDPRRATAVPAYRHPESGRTVAWHQDGHAFTATGVPAGAAIESTE